MQRQCKFTGNDNGLSLTHELTRKSELGSRYNEFWIETAADFISTKEISKPMNFDRLTSVSMCRRLFVIFLAYQNIKPEP